MQRTGRPNWNFQWAWSVSKSAARLYLFWSALIVVGVEIAQAAEALQIEFIKLIEFIS